MADKFEFTALALYNGFGFTMPDGRTATLLSNGRTPFEWFVMFSDNTTDVLSEEFILNELNNPTRQEDNSDGTQAG
jgi:hypothetical protein